MGIMATTMTQAVVTQTLRQPKDRTANVTVKGRAASPTVKPRPANDKARPRNLLNQRDIVVIATCDSIPWPKKRNSAKATTSSATLLRLAMNTAVQASPTMEPTARMRGLRRSARAPANTSVRALAIVAMV
jgi:hypothetical protein